MMKADAANGDRELRLELDSLKRRLWEAEATLEAIRAGRVDALVISNDKDEDKVEIRTILDMGSLGDSLFNQVAQPIFILDGSYRILRSNQPAQELCGRNPANLPFREALDLRPSGQDGEPAADSAPQRIGGNTLGDWISEQRHISAMDVYYDHPDLGTRFYLLDANPVVLSWEGSAGGIVTLMDITARKLSEIQLSVRSGQLAHQFNLLKSISDNIAEGLILIDEERKVIFHNPAVLELLDVPETEFLGRDLEDVFRIESETGKLPIVGPKAVPHGKSEVVSHAGKLLGREGRKTPVQYSLYPVKDGDEVRGHILVVSDISERLATERQLLQSVEKQQQSQKMEAIGRLAGGIAHDFNNLLLAILGFTDISLAQIDPLDPIHENLVEVKKAGDKAAALTSQLLAYSRKQMLAPKIHHVNEAIEDLRKMVGRLLGEKIHLEVSLSPDPLWAKIDQSKLQQVLVNMVLNAKDAMPEGGDLSIRTGRLDIRSFDTSGMVGEIRREIEEGFPPGSYACIEIEDTGHGMSESVMERLFEPFFTTKEFGKGSGLGLSTAYGIIRQLGGYMQVFSEVGRGSVFKVILPLSKDAAPEGTAAQSAKTGQPDGKGRVILLVEDEDVVRRLLSKVLMDQGYKVIEATDGEDALRKIPAQGEDLALIVTDLIMDGMGGIELAEHLARIRPEVEILFMSGYAEDQHKLPLVGGEPPFFAAKPFRPVEFLAKVRSILDLSRRS
jgi:two-component system cell cycle sensor histidine kinase/response regulator CckA